MVVFSIENGHVKRQPVRRGRDIAFIRADPRATTVGVTVLGFINAPPGYPVYTGPPVL